MVESTIPENVERSCLIYHWTVNGKPKQFVSQSFPFDATALEYHVMNKDIALYIAKNDSGKFLFDLKKQ